jgi:hypothetical protein
MANPSKRPAAQDPAVQARLDEEPASRRERAPMDPARRRRHDEVIARVVDQHRDLFVALAKR